MLGMEGAPVTDIERLADLAGNVKQAIRRARECTVFYTSKDKFKILTQGARIAKESRRSTVVGTYDENFVRADLIEDMQCTLSDVQGMTAL